MGTNYLGQFVVAGLSQNDPDLTRVVNQDHFDTFAPFIVNDSTLWAYRLYRVKLQDNQLVPDHRRELLEISYMKIREKTATERLLKIILKLFRDAEESEKPIYWRPIRSTQDFIPYYQNRFSLKVIDGIIFVEDRVAIPQDLQSFLVKLAHYDHPGKQRMREAFIGR